MIGSSGGKKQDHLHYQCEHQSALVGAAKALDPATRGAVAGCNDPPQAPSGGKRPVVLGMEHIAGLIKEASSTVTIGFLRALAAVTDPPAPAAQIGGTQK